MKAMLRPRWIGLAAVLLLAAAILLSTEYTSTGSPDTARQQRFDPARYGADNYQSKVVPAIEQSATSLPELFAALTADKEAAGQRYGHRQGTGPYSFAVKGEGVAGAVKGTLLAVTGTGLPETTTVSIQIGPAINGTALRDAAGYIAFGQFLNQVEYADAATALNNQMRAALLTRLDPTALNGKKISFTGAITFLTPTVITITPVAIKEQP